MHALLLIAHGSRREASNQEVRELAARLEQAATWRATSPLNCKIGLLVMAGPDFQ